MLLLVCAQPNHRPHGQSLEGIEGRFELLLDICVGVALFACWHPVCRDYNDDALAIITELVHVSCVVKLATDGNKVGGQGGAAAWPRVLHDIPHLMDVVGPADNRVLLASPRVQVVEKVELRGPTAPVG